MEGPVLANVVEASCTSIVHFPRVEVEVHVWVVWQLGQGQYVHGIDLGLGRCSAFWVGGWGFVFFIFI
jgi:hypothetical protein